MNWPFRIGTRGSSLALWQASFIEHLLLKEFPNLKSEIIAIKTTGDKMSASPLSKIGGKGVFVKEIEEALISKSIDIAVHSMKDLPTLLPTNLAIGGVAKRYEPRDALISANGFKLAELPQGARVGTGSLRRASQLIYSFPGLRIVPIRGNVDTRIRRLKESGEFDAIILAMAGLERMGLSSEASEVVSADLLLPAPGQGAIAVECRKGDERVFEMLLRISHEETRIEVAAERAFLRELSADCNVPVGAYASIDKDSLSITGLVASPDGKEIIRKEKRGSREEAEALGQGLAGLILSDGGDKILAKLRL